MKVRDVLDAMLRLKGSQARLAAEFHGRPTDRTVRDWFKKGNDELAKKMLPENLDAIRTVAARLGIDVEPDTPAPRLWRPDLSYDENLRFDVPLPDGATPSRQHHRASFLGLDLLSPFGASASVLTSSSVRVRYLACTGCDLITFKTVRSHSCVPHPTPNIFYCREDVGVLDPDRKARTPVMVRDPSPDDRAVAGMMNRFGMPSPPSEDWQGEFRRATAQLRVGQVLILSVVGTAAKDDPDTVLIRDFVKVVELAIEAGAEIIELNLSCPNCNGREGSVYQHPQLALRICKAVRRVAPSVRLLLKIGYMSESKLREFVLDTGAEVNGYSAINTLPVEGMRQGQSGPEPAYGYPGLTAGLSGRPIFQYGLRCVERLAKLKARERMNMAIIGIGGVSSPEDVRSYLNAGATAVQATTAFFENPLFGLAVQRSMEAIFTRVPMTEAEKVDAARLAWLKAVDALVVEMPRQEREIMDAGSAEWFHWRQALREGELGPRRGATNPTAEDFKRSIRARLGR